MWGLLLPVLLAQPVPDANSYVQVALNTKFSLGWLFTNTTIQFTLIVLLTQCRLAGWCGIGFAGDMQDADMIVAFTNGGDVQAWDMYAVGGTVPVNDTELGGVDNVQLVQGNYSGGYTYATVERLLITKDSLDSPLSVGLMTPFCFAYYDRGDSFAPRRYLGTGQITFGNNQTSSFFFPLKVYSDDYKTHGIMLGVAWMPVMLGSIIAARHFKYHWLWYWVHLAAGMYALVVTYIYGMWAYDQDKPVYEWTVKQWLFHERLGFTLMAFLPVQFFSGLLARFWTWKTTSVQALSVTRRLHYISGWSLMVIAQIAIYYGLQGYKPKEIDQLNWAFPTLAAILVVFETWHWFGATVKRVLFKRPKMTFKEVFDQVVLEDRKLIFFDNLVLDIRPFIDSHPGGSAVLYDSMGEDHGKYIYGVIGAGTQQAAFAHPQVMWKYVRQLTIAEVDCHQGVIVARTGSAHLQDMKWAVASTTLVAAKTTCFSFSSDTMFVRSQPEGVEWMGSHCRVSVRMSNSTVIHRYYSLCLFFNIENLQRWTETCRQLGFQVKTPAGEFSGANTTLDLVVKEYAPYGRMSTYLHQAQVGTEVTVSGPMGPGLLLTPKLTGHFCAFGAGTGVLPFLDLVEFLWWKELRSQGNSPSSRYDALNDFTLTLYASFYKAEDVIARDLMQNTHRLCAVSTPPRFKLVLFLDEEMHPDPNELVSGLLSETQVSRVWVCGPTGFCKWIKQHALSSGLKRHSIFIM